VLCIIFDNKVEI